LRSRWYTGNTIPLIIQVFRKSIEPLINWALSAAWAETAELEKLKDLNPDGLFYKIEDLQKWLIERM